MMSAKKRLRRFISNKKEQIARGREITMQMEAERLRKRQMKLLDMDESAWKSVLLGLQNHDSPLDVMKQEYSRRRAKREKK